MKWIIKQVTFVLVVVLSPVWLNAQERKNIAASFNSPSATSLTDTVRHFDLQPLLPADYYAQHIGFFCKQEVKRDKATPLKIRFRLGNTGDCERMEGK